MHLETATGQCERSWSWVVVLGQILSLHDHEAVTEHIAHPCCRVPHRELVHTLAAAVVLLSVPLCPRLPGHARHYGCHSAQ